MHYHTHRPGDYYGRNRGGRRHEYRRNRCCYHHWRGRKYHRRGRGRHHHDRAGRGILSQSSPQQ